VLDQYGDTASGTFNVTTDYEPAVGIDARPVGLRQTVNLTNLVNGLIIPGIAGDSETLTSVTAAHGPARLTNGVLTYAAPSIGSDAIAYAVVDQYGDTASGTVNVTIDPGPTAATGATTVGHNQTINL